MKVTPMDIRAYQFKKTMRGFDPREVESVRDLAADALEDALREIAGLEERLKEAMRRLEGHQAGEAALRDTLTTAQRMTEDLKAGAARESELIIAEARLRAEEIIRQAQTRLHELQEEIFRLRKQRKELEISLKAVIDYHSSSLMLEEEESKRSGEMAEKVRPFGRKE
ncbi:MAG: DivIVA domain-containing protein [Deltaproteobacteria bacterium]|nr:DivIVA domain-containing protein [Deltaproteobacteria bacterium]